MDANKQRIADLAKIYAAMIEPVPGEAYDETARRLRAAVGGRIEKPVFRMAVELIRNNNNGWSN